MPLQPWALMWLIAGGLWTACKLATAVAAAGTLRPARAGGYLLLWPGMDPAPFADGANRAPTAEWSELFAALRNIVAGAGLLWLAAPALSGGHPTAAAWAGMIGVALLLHFGAFALIAGAWQAAGVPVRPLMNRPAASASLSEFWGRRWNTAFHRLAENWVFRPLVRPLGAPAAVAATFLASGLVHDLVISVPAGGGYGLPTLYFAIQAAGVLIERSALGRRLGLHRAPAGRALAAITVIAPLGLLFHPTFVREVVIPFFAAIGAR